MTTPYWQTADFSPAPCLPCCSTPTPSDCSCALLIPPFASPYADYATAAAVVADPLQVASCIVYSNDTFANSLTASFDGTTLAVSANFPSDTASFGDVWVSIAAKSGATISLAFTDAANGAMRIYGCDGTEIEFLGPSTSPVVSSALTADGEYFIAIALSSPPMTSTFTSCSFALTSSNTYWVNPVVALWDDSGTTRSLWACPKLLLPPLTEGTGTWYASCADAHAALADVLQVSNCVGHIETFGSAVSSFTATDGGASLDLNGDVAGDEFERPVEVKMWGSINAEAGQTLSMAWDYSSTGTGHYSSDGVVNFAIYDDAGVLLEIVTQSPIFSDTDSGTLVSSVLPYTGKYTIYAYALGHYELIDPGDTSLLSLDATVTSSGTLSVNEIQARYDLGLTCPGTLNCGDSCP